jgi:hypothetical protein
MTDKALAFVGVEPINHLGGPSRESLILNGNKVELGYTIIR